MGARSTLACCALALIGMAQVAAAAENTPGSACAAANLWQWGGGPENSGSTNGMFCNGSAWTGIINFQSTGKVGIGTTSPQTELDVNGTLRLGYSGEGCSTATVGALYYSSAAHLLYGCLTAGGWTQITTGTGGGVPAGANQQVQFNNAGAFGGSVNMTWNGRTFAVSHSAASATAAIQGTTSSATAGAAGIKGVASGTAGATRAVYGYNASSTGYAGYFYDDSGSGTSYGVYAGVDSAAGYGGYFTNTGGGAALYANGKVGVGTGSPAAQLDVNGGVRVGNDTGSCTSTNNGELRYDGSSWTYCNGSAWSPFKSPICGVYGFAFTEPSPRPPSTLTESDIVQVVTDSCAASVHIEGDGNPAFRTCADSACSSVIQDWGSADATISSGDYLQVRLTSSASEETDHATISVSGLLNTLSVETAGPHKTVFITSTLYNANLGGVAGADAKCASAASAAGLSGTYLAWIADSTDASAPASRFTQASIPYRRVDLVKVADNWADLTDGTLDADMNADEYGNPSSISDGNFIVNGVPNKPIYSNVKPDGTRLGTNNCGQWTSNSGFTLSYGDAKATDS